MKHRALSLLLTLAALLLVAAATPRLLAQGIGSVDTSFDAGLSGDSVSVVAPQPDGKILIALTYYDASSNRIGKLLRYNTDNTLDATFSVEADGEILALAVQGDGKILVGGQFGNVNGVSRPALVRVDASGVVDTGFDARLGNGTNPTTVKNVCVQRDGNLMLGGYFSTLNGVTRVGLARVSATGALDAAFDGKLSTYPSITTLQANGDVLLAVGNIAVGTENVSGMVRLSQIDGSRDTSFTFGLDGFTVSMAPLPNGQILVGGFFSVDGNPSTAGLFRLDDHGNLDTGFNPTVDNIVLGFAAQADGKVLLAGGFTQVNGLSRNGIARLFADGRLDRDFDPGSGCNYGVFGVTLQGDGKAYLYGALDTVNGSRRNFVARLHSDPALQSISVPDSSQVVWKRGGSAPVVTNVTFDKSTDGGATWTFLGRPNQLEVTGDWLLTGLSLPANVSIRARGVAVSGRDSASSGLVGQVEDCGTEGSLALSFHPNPNGYVYAMAVQPDGKTVIGGAFTDIGGVARKHVARLNADGSLDTAFTAEVDNTVLCLAVQPDGKILVGGQFLASGATTRNHIARFNADGTLDPDFNPDLDHLIYCIGLQADGRIYIGGDFTTIGGVNQVRFARLRADGSRDPLFSPSPGGSVNCLVMEPDGSMVVGGEFDFIAGNSRSRLARFDSAGSLDVNFNPGSDGNIYSMALQGDGRIVVGGDFTTVGGSTHVRLARLESNGTPDDTFNPSLGNYPVALAMQADGKILAGGLFTQVNGGSRVNLVRFNTDGTIDGSFGTTTNGSLQAIAVQTDGKVLLGGFFSQAAGLPSTSLARINNGPASQGLVAVSGTQVLWNRSGATTEVYDATVDLSTDGGANWTSLGKATRVANSSNWSLNGAIPTAGRLRVYARTASGTYSASSGFVTDSAGYEVAPVVTTDAASSITSSSATLAASVRSNSDATVDFQYSTDANLSTGVVTTGSLDHVGDPAATSYTPSVSGLVGHTTYYFRARATNSAGTNVGGIRSFTTPNTPPTASDETVTMAPGESTSVTLNYADADGDMVTLDAMLVGTIHVSIQGSMGSTLFLTANPVNNFSGDTTFSYHVSDGHGGTATGTVTVTITGNNDPQTSVLFSKGAAVPGAGSVGGAPAGATFTGFGVPSINDNGKVAFLGKWTSASGAGAGIFAGNPAALVVKAGDTAPISGLTFASFSDPVLNENGEVAFTAKLAGTGVKDSNDTALYTNAFSSGVLSLVAREGDTADSADRAKILNFASFSLQGGGVAYVVNLTAGKPLVTTANNRMALLKTATFTHSIVRTGWDVGYLGQSSTTVKSFSLLGTVAGSAGQSRGQVAEQRFHYMAVFKDGRQVLIEDYMGMSGALAISGGTTGGTTLPAATFKSFGPIASSPGSTYAAMAATLNTGAGGVTAGNANGVFVGKGAQFEPVVRAGDGVSMVGPLAFASFKAPVIAPDSKAVAFPTTLGGTGVTAANDSALALSDTTGAIRLIAREGGNPAGTPAAAKWLAFKSLALPGGAGTGRPLFVATLKQGVGAVTESNDTGLWAVDRFGALRLLVREGDKIGGKKVQSFTVLKAVAGAPGVTRSFNNSREVIYRATFTDASQAIVYVLVP